MSMSDEMWLEVHDWLEDNAVYLRNTCKRLFRLLAYRNQHLDSIFYNKRYSPSETLSG